jgi:DNA-binding winged helix-turn-helix (wHTH) protein/TolB-like protein/Flp pilus assembly protein TadD
MQVLEDNNYSFGKFRLDKSNKVLRYEDEVVSLSLKAVELLCLLIDKRGEVVSKNEIFEKVWNDSFVEDSVLTSNIYTLRKMFESFGETDLIKTVPRRGYVFGYEEKPQKSLKIQREVYEEIEIIEENIQNTPALPLAQKTKRKYLYLLFAIFLLTSIAYGYWSLANNYEKKSLTQVKSIAFLPIKTLTDTENEKVLANGIREKLGSSLGVLKGIKILNNESAESDIDKLVDFDAVLLGTLQQSEDKIRVNLRLLKTKNAEQIWTGTFNELKSDIFQLQDKISDEITKSLSLDLSKQDREIVFKRETTNKEAYEQYLQGRYFFNQRGIDYSGSLKKAKPFFEKGIELDPNFAQSYVGLADVINLQADVKNKLDPEYDKNYQKSKELISKALAINPNLAEAYAAKGWIELRYEWNFAEAELSLKKAIELNPNLTNAYIWLSQTYQVLGKTDIAVKNAEKALEIEPTLSRALGNLGSNYVYNGQCDKAFENFDRLTKYYTNNVTKDDEKGRLFSQCGKCVEAIPILIEVKKAQPNASVVAYNLGFCYATLNEPEKAREELKLLESNPKNGHSTFGRILIHYTLGENEKALSILNDFYKSKDARIQRILFDPRLKNLKNETKFKEITKDLNLVK